MDIVTVSTPSQKNFDVGIILGFSLCPRYFQNDDSHSSLARRRLVVGTNRHFFTRLNYFDQYLDVSSRL